MGQTETQLKPSSATSAAATTAFIWLYGPGLTDESSLSTAAVCHAANQGPGC